MSSRAARARTRWNGLIFCLAQSISGVKGSRDAASRLGRVHVLVGLGLCLWGHGHRPWHGEHGRLRAGTGAVSYTHLRAHETVLDLVCRLLLEKKKKKK